MSRFCTRELQLQFSGSQLSSYELTSTYALGNQCHSSSSGAAFIARPLSLYRYLTLTSSLPFSCPSALLFSCTFYSPVLGPRFVSPSSGVCHRPLAAISRNPSICIFIFSPICIYIMLFPTLHPCSD